LLEHFYELQPRFRSRAQSLQTSQPFDPAHGTRRVSVTGALPILALHSSMALPAALLVAIQMARNHACCNSQSRGCYRRIAKPGLTFFKHRLAAKPGLTLAKNKVAARHQFSTADLLSWLDSRSLNYSITTCSSLSPNIGSLTTLALSSLSLQLPLIESLPNLGLKSRK